MNRQNKIYLCAFTIIVLLIPTLVSSNYYLMVLNIAALNIIVVVGLNLFVGYAGQISLGHAAFYGMGAYISAILTTTIGLPAWPTIILAMVITGLVAYVIGIPTLKLEGHYLVMATLGFSIIINILMVQLDGLTGGPSGFPGISHLGIGPIVFATDFTFYYLVWPICVGILILSFNLIRSRIGRAMAALSSNEIAAGCAGIDTDALKIQIFVLSAVLGSLAGSLYAHYVTFISPETFSFFYSIQVITMVIIGGMGSIWGSVFGALLLTILPQILHVVEAYSVLTYGGILMVVLVFFPQGLFPGLVEAYRKRRPAAMPLSVKEVRQG